MNVVNALLGSSAAKVDKKVRIIKRLERWLTAHGENGRKITGPLVGVNDLRQGDEHIGESTAKAALPIFGIPIDAEDYQQICMRVIGSVSWSLGWIAKTIAEKGPLP